MERRLKTVAARLTSSGSTFQIGQKHGSSFVVLNGKCLYLTMANDSNKDILLDKLAGILGFDDGVDHVLEHLLSIESSQDLSDYLGQLLGSENASIKDFVADIGRHRRGEKIKVAAASGKLSIAATAAAPSDFKVASEDLEKRTMSTATQKDRSRDPRSQTLLTNKSSTAALSRRKKTPPRKLPGHVNTKFAPGTSKSAPASASTTIDSFRSESTVIVIKPPNSEILQENAPKKEQRGNASIECGCFGSIHKALANCLHCGRISCEREGYDFCNFCGYLVEAVRPPTRVDGRSSMDEAWQHKERLLQFERESEERTLILDDQADFYREGDVNSSWLTEEERRIASQEEEHRQDANLQRKKIHLNVDI